MSRLVLVTALVSFLALLSTLFCLDPATEEALPGALLPTDGMQHVFALGRVEGVTEEVELRPQLIGQVTDIPVTEGQLVERGQLLLRLDDRHHRHLRDLAAAELELAKAQLQRLVNGATQNERDEAAALHEAKLAELERAQRNWHRVQQLRHADAIAEQQADDRLSRVKSLAAEVHAAKARLDHLQAPAREDEVHIARSRLDAARARLLAAEAELAWTQLTAVCPCQVLSINAQVGELTGPQAAEPAVIVADASQLYVRALIEEMDAPRIHAGMVASVRADGLPDREFQAFVVHVSPHMSSKTISSDRPGERLDTKVREVWLRLEQSAGLVLGLRVDVFIHALP